MSNLEFSPVTFPEVQRISDVYSSGVWCMPQSFSAGDPQPVWNPAIFKNDTLMPIIAYVTICNEGNPTVSLPVTLVNDLTTVGNIPAGCCMGFLLSIEAGHVLRIYQELLSGGSYSNGTFVIAHAQIGSAKLNDRRSKRAK